MSAHKLHPGAERLEDPDSKEPILYDDCERCVEHSHDPLSLDLAFTRAAWLRMLRVEKGPEAGRESPFGAYRSVAEAQLCGALYQLAVWMERFSGLPPHVVWSETFVPEDREAALARYQSLLALVAALAIYGENANLSALVEKARALNMAEGVVPLRPGE